jgi:hypothetical protein
MKNKKLLALAASAALIANLALGVASAETTTSDQQINGGSLTIVSVPASVNFANVNVSTASQDNISTFGSNSIHIQDTRSTSASFSFTVTATDFQDTSSLGTFALENLSTDVNGGGAINAVGSSDCTSGISLSAGGSLDAFADATPGDPTSDPINYMNGDTRIRVMECQMTPTLEITIPGSTPSGTYRSTLTFAIS